MKGTRAVTLGLLALLVVVVVVDGRREKHRNNPRRSQRLKGGEKSACKYFRKGQISACDEATQTRNMTFLLKKGDKAKCPPTQVFHQPCNQSAAEGMGHSVKGCQYGKAEWTDCGPGVSFRQKVRMLLPGQPEACPATRTKTKPCKNRKNKKDKLRKKGKRKACKYQKGDWSDCSMVTGTRTRQLTLKKGDEKECLPSKTVTKKCKKTCKYIKGPWMPCNEATNEKTRELTLKKGNPAVCNATMTIMKPCRGREAFTAAKTSRCRYKAQPWSECDARTNTMKRVLELKAGNPALCQQTKQLTRKCRKPCKFAKGEWSACDETTGMKTRSDRLVKGDDSKCEATRVISQVCKEEACKYEIGGWGECDQSTQQRTRIKKLLSGDAEKCEMEIRITRPCRKLNGEESCFLGDWGVYGPCLNGVMMKHRPVIAGGMECERKAVKTKPCS